MPGIQRGAFTINQAKSRFLDVQKIENEADRANYRSLARFGAFVRRDAMDRMRSRSRSASPGQGPTKWMGYLKRFLYFIPDLGSQNVIIGPARLSNMPTPGGMTVPELLEYGGTVRRRVTRSMLGRIFRARRYNRDAADVFRALKPYMGQTVSMQYEPRQYMGPAFEENQSRVDDIWADSFR